MASPAATTIILIRHAERDPTSNPNPHLNADGQARAKTLLHVLGKSGLKAIYTSTLIRTQETAQPLTTQLAIMPTQMDEAASLKNDILSKHVGEKVLVVGHTNTIPELIGLLGGGAFGIAESQFDKLFVLTFFSPGAASVLEMKYGKPS